jgi:transposase
MRPPIFVRPLTDAERAVLEDGLRSSDAFVLRRCQVLLASARGERAPAIAHSLGCDDQTVRNVIRAFEATGLGCLQRQSSRPHTTHPRFTPDAPERLREVLHRSPRDFGYPTSLWTLDLAAEVACTEGLTTGRVSGEAIRQALARLGVRWRRAKTWITSPDPAYAQKNGAATA